ncbi:MAG: hypothetical protein J6C13_01185 [Clostridia bacterium]|nr:hypothetical protein [Clostridia bacterium]
MKDSKQDNVKNPVSTLIGEALENIKMYVDMDTIVGQALQMGDGVVAYPIIKITLGVVAGGGQYANKMIVRKTNNEYPFAGGTGAGFTAEPMGFLIVNKGEHQLITIQNENAWASTMSKVGDALGEYLKTIAKKEVKKGKGE